MAIAVSTSALTDELIESVAKTSADKAFGKPSLCLESLSCANLFQDPSHYKDLKRRVEETIKSSAYGRTDQFAVAEHLEGLQEKFQVLSRDILADALRERLEELKQHRRPWFPEILSLLLNLSDRPALLSSVDQIEELKPSESESPHDWPNPDASGGAYCDEENLWEHVDFNAETSDDDLSSVSSEVSIPKTSIQGPKEPDDEYIIPDGIFSSGEDENVVSCITNAQFWKTGNDAASRKDKGDCSHFITELQIIRQTIFMLHGLPTSLFWRLDDDIEVDRRYALSHSPNNALASLLQSFSTIGAKLDALRRFNGISQSVPYMQTFHRGVEVCLRDFDAFLSKTEAQYLYYQNSPATNSAISISLLQLLDDVRRESSLLLSLADLVSGLKQNVSQKPAQCLDSLYELVCMSQATGADMEFQFLAKLFFSCFETYARPIRLWMEAGQLEPADGTYFVVENRKEGDLETLWHDWYKLCEDPSLSNVPKFLRSVSQKIFTTGKSMFFLRQLGVLPEDLGCLKKSTLKFEDVYPSGSPTPLYIPFSGLLEVAFEKLIDERQAATAAALRNELSQQCGLWTALEALELIYLCKDISLFGAFDKKIFELIDRGRGAWNDRFLLTELAQNTFGAVPFIESGRLIVRSHKGSYRDVENGDRSVKALWAVSVEYLLPWPIANIVTKDAIFTYRRISTFLMQIRRARYVTVNLQLRKSDKTDGVNNALAYALRHNLLWFLDVLYGHMTELVISTATESMHKALSASKDVDDMISTHRLYMSSLEDQLLLSKNLTPIYEAVINLLDLCIHFADIQQATIHAEKRFERAINRSTSRKDASSHFSQRRSSLNEGSASEDEDRSDEENDDYDDNETTAEDNTQYTRQLRNLKDQYNQLLAFVAAGLKGVGRADGQHSWEMLGEKLEWRKGRAGVGVFA